MLALLLWPAVGERFRKHLFNGGLMLTLTVLGAVALLAASFLLRLVRGSPPESPPAEKS